MAQRSRSFMFVVYPESMGNLFQRIEELNLRGCASPLHDKDVAENDCVKKAHYHIMIVFSSLKSHSQIVELCEKLGVKHFEVPSDVKASLRYFCHLDSKDPRKHHYDPKDVTCFGGFDYSSCLDKTETVSPYVAVLRLIYEQRLDDFRSLVDYVVVYRPELLDLVVDRSYFFGLYLRIQKKPLDVYQDQGLPIRYEKARPVPYNARDQNETVISTA